MSIYITHLSDYITFSDIISERLITRGYDRDLIFKIFTMVTNLDRDSLIEYKNNQNFQSKRIDFKKNLVIKNSFDKNIVNFKEIANVAFENLKKNFPKFKNLDLFIVNKMQNNLSSILVHEFKYP